MIVKSIVTHRNVYLFGLFLLAASLPVSIYTTSIAEIILLGNWILEDNFKNRLRSIARNKPLLLIISLYFLHIVGLLYTSDFNYAIHDLKIKLPILVLPLVFSTSKPVEKKLIKYILIVFSLSVIASSLISAAIFFGLINYEYYDYRDISIFISHIRLSLMVNLAIFILAWFSLDSPKSLRFNKRRAIFAGVAVMWLIFFLVILKAITGIVIFIILSLVITWVLAGRINDVAPRFIVRVFLITVPLIIVSFLASSVEKFYTFDDVDFSKLDKYTAQGNVYRHDTLSRSVENGHYVWIYLSEKELEEQWNKRSEIKYSEKDYKGQYIKYTLIRYLTSLGLRKDSTGVSNLTEKDIYAIENGTANHIFTERYSLYPRIYEIIWEVYAYRRGGDPSGHSVTQRIAYLKGAKKIISENLLIGVGTGDIQQDFNKYYNEVNSPLDKDSRRRAHNQFVTFLLTFGIIGFIISMLAFILPVILSGAYKHNIFVVFLIIAFFSMLNEDTLETQTGVSFIMFFYALFIFTNKNGNREA